MPLINIFLDEKTAAVAVLNTCGKGKPEQVVCSQNDPIFAPNPSINCSMQLQDTINPQFAITSSHLKQSLLPNAQGDLNVFDNTVPIEIFEKINSSRIVLKINRSLLLIFRIFLMIQNACLGHIMG